jgi:hypothetical protein
MKINEGNKRMFRSVFTTQNDFIAEQEIHTYHKFQASFALQQ